MNDFRKTRTPGRIGPEDLAERAESELLIRRYNEEEIRLRMQEFLYGAPPQRIDSDKA